MLAPRCSCHLIGKHIIMPSLQPRTTTAGRARRPERTIESVSDQSIDNKGMNTVANGLGVITVARIDWLIDRGNQSKSKEQIIESVGEGRSISGGRGYGSQWEESGYGSEENLINDWIR